MMSAALKITGLLPAPCSVRSHPEQYVRRAVLRDGVPIVVRPIRATDAQLLGAFHEALDERTVRFRYFGRYAVGRRIEPTRLTEVCCCDFDRDIAVVAERSRGANGSQIIGVGRLTKLHHDGEAEAALVVEDDWQNDGVGSALMKLLLEIARDEGIQRIVGHMPADDAAMRHVAQKFGFETKFDSKALQWGARLELV